MAQFGWYPKYKNIYQSWNDDGRNHRNHSHMSGRVIIHIGDKSYPGSFSVGHTHVTVRYDGREIVVSKELGRFTKHIDGRTVYYNAYFDESSIKTNVTTNGENMAAQKENSDEGYKPYVEPGVGFIDRLLKRTDPVYWKKTIQTELDKRWAAYDTTADKLKEGFEKFNRQAMEITEEEHNVDTYNQEWAESLTSLGNLLNKNTSHEKQMWDTTQKNRNVKGLKIKQKFKDSDVDEIRFNNMMEYIKQYPELQAQKTVDKLVENVKSKRDDIVSTSKTYRQAIKEANVYLNIAKNKLQESEDELAAFESMKKEGEQKVNEAQDKGLINKILNKTKTAAEKQSTRLVFYEYDRKIDVSKNQLKLIKERIKDYEGRTFKPIVTTKFKDIEE